MSASRLIPTDFDAIPSHSASHTVRVQVSHTLPDDCDVVGFAVAPGGAVPEAILIGRESLTRAGFVGTAGETLLLAQPTGPVFMVFGVGDAATQTSHSLRDAVATFALATKMYPQIAVDLGEAFSALDDHDIGQTVTEAALLARYRFTELQRTPKSIPLRSLTIRASKDRTAAVTLGASRGEITARATNLARDLANNPPGHLTATRMGEVAVSLGADAGLAVEVFDKRQLIELGCGGLLGVNAGSAEEPRMIKLTYSPPRPTSRIALVGKGIMYDSGGISLKPSDPMHLIMKMDMAGAAAVLGVMTSLNALECTSEVTAYLMCTDNMPSGTAIGLGDVLTIRGGTTVEVKNTDAEGRLVMADALVLATEWKPDAIIDIATLTGSALQALGTRVAAVFGNQQDLVEQAKNASETTDEPIWQLPLEHRYREQLNSTLADISNMGGPFNVAITAALFLNEFVADYPWVHFDIAGTMHAKKDEVWRPEGATGFGTRLLLDLVLNFQKVR